MKVTKTKVMGATIAILALALVGVGAYAYFSGTTDTVENEIALVTGEQGGSGSTIGTITEAAWDAFKEKDENEDGVKDCKQLMPGQTIDKDPLLTSAVSYPAVGYLLVTYPTVTGKITNDTTDKVYTIVELPEAGDLGADWSIVATRTSTTAGTDTAVLYRYNKVLNPSTSTTKLFETLTVQSFISLASQSGLADSIDVTGALVQVDGNATIGAEGALTVETACDTIAKGLVDYDNAGKITSSGTLSVSNFHTFASNQTTTITSIVFDITGVSDTSGKTDVSEEQNGSIYAWMDGTTMHVADKTAGAKVKAPQFSGALFTGSGNEGWQADIMNMDVTNLDVSNVTSMGDMFLSVGYNSSSLEIIGLDTWDTSKVTNMSYMFQNTGYSAGEFNLDLSALDTTSVTNMSDMFSDTGHDATTWTVKIPAKTGTLDNDVNHYYGKTGDTFAIPFTGKEFTVVSN